VPERLQPEVERQLKEMLAHGIIRESNSPMASPLVCVLKGKGGCDGVRLTVDYRYVNRFTVSDAFPIPEMEDVIQRIGGKRYITSMVAVPAITKRNEGITLNLKKCRFAQHTVKFCDEIIRRPDPEKVAAIHEMREPETVLRYRCFRCYFEYTSYTNICFRIQILRIFRSHFRVKLLHTAPTSADVFSIFAFSHVPFLL